MRETILVLNAGSSSLKFQLFAIEPPQKLDRLVKGQVEGIGVAPHLIMKSAQGELLKDQHWSARDLATPHQALEEVVQVLREYLDGALPVAIGHRVVHGGIHFSAPTVIDGDVIERLEPLAPLAPLHQPHNLTPIKIIHERLPNVMQVACFDTAFHRTHSTLADRYAIPEPFYAEGVRRYGFHGLSYEFIAERLRTVAPSVARGKIIVAHLGSGASMCAISNGKSVDSTMGFTALDGLPMGTRPGQLDAGVVLFLVQQKGMTPAQVEHFLYHDCGLKALSGISNDVRVLLASKEPGARLALDFFAYRIAVCAGSLAAAMEGLDGFVFTAGIGENAPSIRASVAKRLAWMGLEMDEQANEHGGPLISTRQSRIACYVIPTDEELMIARHTLNCMAAATQS